MAQAHPERYLVVDGTSAPDQIHAVILDRLDQMGVLDR